MAALALRGSGLNPSALKDESFRNPLRGAQFFIRIPSLITRATISPWPPSTAITPCFIVDNLQVTLDFYQSKLGFEITYKGGGNGDGNGDDFWAFVRRDGVMISLKAIAPEIHPQPNHSRHEWARWDAYIHTSDPDSLYEE